MTKSIRYSTDRTCPYCKSAVVHKILFSKTLDHSTAICGGCFELYNYREEMTDEDIARADRFLKTFQRLNRLSKMRILNGN